MQQERNSFVLISSSEATLNRFKQAAEFVMVQTVFYASLKFFLDDDTVRPRTLLIDLCGLGEADQELLGKMKKLLPKTQVIGLVEKREEKKTEWVLQHYLTTEMISTFMLEFVLFQRNFGEFYEISPTDLFPDTVVYFNAYHYLPLNQKYLPFIHEDFKLSDKKHKRIDAFKVLYITKSDCAAYAQYIEKYFDQFKVGLRKRAKSRTYQLLVEWRDLIYSYLLEGREVESCATTRPDFAVWLNDMLNYFANSEEPWGLIHELSNLNCFSSDRSLLEVMIASFLSRNLGKDEAEKIIDLKLLLTIGRFHTDSLLFKKWYLGEDLGPTEKEKWNRYPEVLKTYKFSPEFPLDVVANLDQFQKQFLTKADKNVNYGRLVHCYLGELIVAILQKNPVEQFNKDEFAENIIVKCKADGILSEAWLEELRQFLKK